jgi:hypothetical protein
LISYLAFYCFVFVLLFLRGLFLCYYIAILLCVDCCLVAVITGIVATAAGRFSELPTESFCDFIADIHCVMIGSRTIMANIRTIEGQPQLDKLAGGGGARLSPNAATTTKGCFTGGQVGSKSGIRRPKAESTPGRKIVAAIGSAHVRNSGSAAPCLCGLMMPASTAC